MPRWMPRCGPSPPSAVTVSHHMVLPRRCAATSRPPLSAWSISPGWCGRQTNSSRSSTPAIVRSRAFSTTWRAFSTSGSSGTGSACPAVGAGFTRRASARTGCRVADTWRHDERSWITPAPRRHARHRPRGGPRGAAAGGVPVGAALFGARRHAARARPQPPRPGRRPRHPRRDRRVPRRRAPPALPRHDAGHDALAVLVLRGAGPPVPHPAPGRRRGARTSAGSTSGSSSRASRSPCSTTRSARELMARFAAEQPETWIEDIGGPA